MNALRLDDAELELFRPFLNDEYRDISSPELAEIVADGLEGWTETEIRALVDSLERFNAGRFFTGLLSGAGSGAATGTAVMPGWGTAIGAGLGALLGGLTSAFGGGGRRPSRRPARPSRPAPGPVRPRRLPATRRPTVARRPPTGRGGGSAAAALRQVLQNPQLMQALMSTILRLAGQRGVRLGARGDFVSRGAVLEALEVLAGLAAEEAAALDDGTGSVAYLKDDAGELLGDPSNQEFRAFRVLDLLREDLDRYALTDDEIRQRLEEAIIEPLSRHCSNLARFRAGVPNTRIFPHSAICQLRITMDRLAPGRVGIGTGFYIGPNRILTAGHNVLHRRHGRATRMVVAPARNGRSRPFGSFEVLPGAMTLHPRWASNPTNADFDLAVLTVRTGPPNGRYFDLAEIRRMPECSLAVCGYAASRAAGVDPDEQNIDFDTVRNLGRESFTYSLHTTGGTSGSPCMWTRRSGILVVGVHSRAHGRHTNKGCALTASKIGWIRSVTDEMLPAELEREAYDDTADVIAFDREELAGADAAVEAIAEDSAETDAAPDDEERALDELTRIGALAPEDESGDAGWEDAALDELALMGAFDIGESAGNEVEGETG